VRLPANTTGTLHLPVARAELIRLDGESLTGAEWVRVLREAEGNVTLSVASGRYRFEWPVGEATASVR
jgi:hypothetical protein